MVRLYPTFRGKKSPINKLKTAGHWNLSVTDKFSSYSANIFLHDVYVSAVTSSSHLRLPSDLFPSAFQLKFCIHYSHPPCMLHSHPMSAYLLVVLIKVGKTFQYSISFMIFSLSPSHVRDTPLISQFPKASNEVMCVLNVKA